MVKGFGTGFAPDYEVDGQTLDETGEMDKDKWVDNLISKGNWIELAKTLGTELRIKKQIQLIPSVPIILPLGMPTGIRRSPPLNVTIEARLELWLNSDEGDWAANILQGIGRDTQHYGEDLMKAVDDAMDVAEGYGKKLRITGHSLGGGLASAAAIYAKARDPDMKIYGLTYDASGVHPNTAEYLKTSLDLASDAKIIARAVEDEILTSLEIPSDFVPIISSIVRFTGNSMPPPLGTFYSAKGVSPGKMGGKEKGHTFAPKWKEMPNLLPIEKQTLIPAKNGKDPLATWGNLAGLMASARNIGEVLENFHNEISKRVDSARADRTAQEAEEVRVEAAREAADDRREAAAEQAETVREASEEQAEADAERAAAVKENEAESNEPSGYLGVPWFFYNLYDEPRDFVRGTGNVISEVGDEIGDVAVNVADEVGDIGREVWDEAGDGIRNIGDAAGDLKAFAYQHTIQYMDEFVQYGQDLKSEAGGFNKLFGAIIAYHNPELAVFTFAMKKKE